MPQNHADHRSDSWSAPQKYIKKVGLINSLRCGHLPQLTTGLQMNPPTKQTELVQIRPATDNNDPRTPLHDPQHNRQLTTEQTITTTQLQASSIEWKEAMQWLLNCKHSHGGWKTKVSPLKTLRVLQSAEDRTDSTYPKTSSVSPTAIFKRQLSVVFSCWKTLVSYGKTL